MTYIADYLTKIADYIGMTSENALYYVFGVLVAVFVLLLIKRR